MIVNVTRRGHRFIGEVREGVRKNCGALVLNNAPMDASQAQAVTFCKTKTASISR